MTEEESKKATEMQDKKFEVCRKGFIEDKQSGQTYEWKWTFGWDMVELADTYDDEPIGTTKLNVRKDWLSPEYRPMVVDIGGRTAQISEDVHSQFKKVCDELASVEKEIYNVLEQKINRGAEAFSKKELSKHGLFSFTEWTNNNYDVHMERYRIIDRITDWVIRSAIWSTLTGNEDEIEMICREECPVWHEFEYRISDFIHDDNRR